MAEQVYDLSFYIDLINVFLTCFCSFGVVANVINIAVFSMQGINDSISVQFLCLSISDLLYSLVCLLFAGSMWFFFLRPEIDSWVQYNLGTYTGPPRATFSTVSTLITIFLSIERCCCVVIPFKVKLFFTKRRTIITVVIINLYAVSWLYPDYVTHGYRAAYDPDLNRTQMIYWQDDSRTDFEFAFFTLVKGILPVMATIVMLISTSLMISALKASNKTRKTAMTEISENREDAKESSRAGSRVVHARTASKVTPKEVLSGKEARLAKTVIAINILFLFCNTPQIAMIGITAIKYINPSLNVWNEGKYQALLNLLHMSYVPFESLNASANFFIYYVRNNKFRATCKKLFRCRAEM